MLTKTRHKTFKYSAIALLAWGALNVGFLYVTRQAPTANAAEQMPALPVVDALTLELHPLRDWSSYSGRLQAVNAADIRPLVSGTIQQVLFADGAQVEAGQLLFVIDPRPFAARVQHARAALSSAESNEALARVEFERADSLVGNQAVSRSIRDARENDLRVAKAALESARAQLQEAELDLEYAYVKAPFAGRVGRAEVTIGNVVQAGGNAPVLTSLVSMDRLYAEFDVDEETYFRVMRSLSEGVSEEPEQHSVPVEVALGAAQGAVHTASLVAFDNKLDESTGTVRARALVDNMDGTLIPGIFVSVRIGTADLVPSLLVPERAIGVNQDKRFVYVVNADNRVEYREVTLGQTLEQKRVVLTGLAPGDRVIVNGVQRVMSDMQVSVSQL
ncbi:MAG: efflux RND transporter periplasmic adaptor subunit [Gammaproteobacteria bacterium]